MYVHARFKSILLFFSLMFCLGTSRLFAAEAAAAEEWIDIEVVVNVVDGADANNVDDAIKKANDALKKAKIRLKKTATDPNAKADKNGSGGLDRGERDNAREEGQGVLDKTVGAGKGIKIDVANNCDADDANAVGVSIHTNPVIIVEPDADANELGKTIAHELGHVLTLDYDKYGPNDVNSLMYGYTGSGTDLNNVEVNEIREGAKVRGVSGWILPWFISGGGVAVPDGINYSVDGFGAVLDNFHDVQVNDPLEMITDPNDPTIQYADIGGVTVFADEPFDPNSVVKMLIQFGRLPVGTWNVDSFFDITYQIEFGPPIGHAHIQLHNWTPTGPAIWYDADGRPTNTNIVVRVNTESEFRGMPHHGEPHNKTLQVEIPIELIPLIFVSALPITVSINSMHQDYRYAPDPTVVVLMDQTLPFKVGLSQPCHCPSLSFVLNNSPAVPDPNGNVNILGCGFAPNVSGRLYVESDSRMIADLPLTTSADGKLADAIGCSILNPAEGWVRVSFQPEYYGPPEAAPKGATGYFRYCPGGEIPGDLNADCVVNLYDFAIVAQHWLEGTTP